MKSSKKLLAILMLVLIVASVLTIAVFADGDSGSSAVTHITCTTCEGSGEFNGEECGECGGTGVLESDSYMAFTFWALVPPLVAIILALITKEVYSSLFIGVLLGAFFYSNWGPVKALDATINDGLIASISDNAGIFLFLVILGIMVALINRSGGSAAFGRWAKTHIKSRTGAIFATFVLGIVIFIDDYFNCLTVGSVMRPIADEHQVSRAKLAYIIDATAAPVCMIAPISSWAAAVAGVVEGGNGIELFVRAIPYNFYSLLTLVFIIAIVMMKFDYGPMKLHEKNAIEHGDLYTTGDRVDKEMAQEPYSEKGRVLDLVLPIIVLIVFSVIGLIYVGGFWDGSSFIDAFANTDAYVGLPWGAMIALLFTIIYLLCRRVISFSDAMACIPKGFINMVPPITILCLATSLKNMTGLLGGKYFVASVMNTAAGSLFSFLPAIIFLVACLLSFSTGTSWGACLAGAVFGDHCSPISDTSIMSSAGAMCLHVNHVTTQIPYAVTVGAICFVTYIAAGLIQNWFVTIILGVALTLGVLFFLRNREAKKDAAAAA